MRLVSLLVVTAIGPLSGCGNAASEAGRGGGAQSSALPATSALASFSLFRRPRGKIDAIPESLLSPHDIQAMGFKPGTSHFARTYHGKRIYVIASPELVCTYSRYNPVGTCWTIPTVSQGDAVASSICGLGTAPREIVIFGIVPDDVRAVTILRQDGIDPTVGVSNNFFVAPVSSTPPLPLRLSFMRDGSRELRSTGIPPRVAQRGCLTNPLDD